MNPTSLTPEALASILARLAALEASGSDQDALLGEHEERLVALESGPAPGDPPEEVPD